MPRTRQNHVRRMRHRRPETALQTLTPTGRIRPRAMISRPVVSSTAYQDNDSDCEYQIGQTVSHATFGDGILVSYEGNGNHARVQVNFDQVGMKWLVLAYANLQPA